MARLKMRNDAAPWSDFDAEGYVKVNYATLLLDLGSMFFVADGISSAEAEFEAAVRSFLGALTPGSPFMTAFMEGSGGYDVSGVQFPAGHRRVLPQNRQLHPPGAARL